MLASIKSIKTTFSLKKVEGTASLAGIICRELFNRDDLYDRADSNLVVILRFTTSK